MSVFPKTFEKFLEEQDLIKDINISFSGLLILNLSDKYESKRNLLNDHLDIDNDDLGINKVKGISTLWYVRCRTKTKKEAAKKIYSYLTDFLKAEKIESLNIAISLNLAHFNHESVDGEYADTIDYNVIDHLDIDKSEVLKDLIEPVQPVLLEWDGKKEKWHVYYEY